MVLKAVALLSLPPWSLEFKELQLRDMLHTAMKNHDLITLNAESLFIHICVLCLVLPCDSMR